MAMPINPGRGPGRPAKVKPLNLSWLWRLPPAPDVLRSQVRCPACLSLDLTAQPMAEEDHWTIHLMCDSGHITAIGLRTAGNGLELHVTRADGRRAGDPVE